MADSISHETVWNMTQEMGKRKLKEIEATREEKVKAVKGQNFELAASFRDKEGELLKLLDAEKEKWDKDVSKKREVGGYQTLSWQQSARNNAHALSIP